MTLEQIQAAIENGYPKDTQKFIAQALKEHLPAERILEEAMLPAMKRTGDIYRNSDASIPRILASARSMQKGLEILQPYLQNSCHSYLATVILGTVEGDLHDMGKNLVAIMFRSVGFKVIDLGVDVSERQFLKAVKDHPEVSLVCISSLLTTTMSEMKKIVKSLRQADPEHRLKIMVGGGPITQNFADAIGADGYTDNAVDAAELAKTFVTNTPKQP